MALRIWETDPENAPKPRQKFADDLVGRFRSGHQLNKRPISLQEWRVTTGDPDVADAIAGMLGGSPDEWDATGEDAIEVFTNAKSVDVILDGPKALQQEMVLWGVSGAIRRCDGVEQHGDEEDKGKACECPASFADRKAAAARGKGCQPNTTIFFRLLDDPELGRFKFVSGSWSLVRDLGEAEAALAKIDGPARAKLSLQLVEFDTAAGEHRKFTKPVVEIVEPYEAGA
jgi:hypothetical protein